MSEQIIIKVDSQILNSMNLCPERYRLEHMENWRPIKKALALERGQLCHLMLAHFYEEKMKGRTRPADMPNLIQECLMLGRVFAANSTHISSEEFQEDERVFKEYFLRWQYDGWEIQAVETPFSKTLYESPALLILYEGIIDILITDPKLGKAVVDTKTESRKSEPYILSNQFQGYEWASEGLPVIVNKIGYQKTAKMEHEDEEHYGKNDKVDMRFRRLIQQSGEAAIKEWREDAIRTIIEAIGWHKAVDEGKRLRKNRTSCDKYGGCIFQKVCKEPEEVRDHKLIVNFYKDKPWDVFERDTEDAVAS
jgi:PD-(D/E)XK nuclease superfamily